MDEGDIENVVRALNHPDVVETVNEANTHDQRTSVAMVKRIGDEYIVIAAIGGKRNPTVAVEMFLKFSEQGYHDTFDGKSMAEVIYEDDQFRKPSQDLIDKYKKNRVTAAHNGLSNPSAGTSSTLLRSPLSKNNLSQGRNSVNVEKALQKDLGVNAKIETDNEGNLQICFRKHIIQMETMNLKIMYFLRRCGQHLIWCR